MKLPGLRLRLATSKIIRQWSERQLPNGKKIHGQILNPKTVHYQTLKPEKDGLFCERLFGPVKDFTCACGRLPLRGQKFCPRCEVEYISARVRRYRLGSIQLVTAAAHIWFFQGRPNYFSIFLNLPKKKIECLLYCTQNISRTIFPRELENLDLKMLSYLKPRRLFFRNFSKENLLSFSSVSKKYWKFQKDLSAKKYTDFFLKKIVLFLTPSIKKKEIFTKKRQENLEAFLLSFQQTKKFNFLRKKFGKKVNNLLCSNFRFRKKSLWKDGGLRDSAIYFGFSLVSKKLSWHWQKITYKNWLSFLYFLIKYPQKGDVLNKFYPGPPGLVNFWGFKSRLFCLTGVQLMRTWLTQLTQYHCNDGGLLEVQIRLELFQLEKCEPLSDNEFLQKIQLFRRLKYLRSFRHTQMNPASMVLSVLPVLPPDLRPILKLENNQMAIADFNQLYQTILLRNRRLSRLTMDQIYFHCLNSEALQYAQRVLQESVDSLIENGNGNTSSSSSSRSLKSLSDLFKGKKGRFRQNLLGKRVDYSGRSVIVVGPYLKIYECGLPKEIAYELFQPFLLRILMFRNQAQTILGAKKLYQQKSQFLWNLLKEIVHSHPILLNRAPTLHRLSIQAFQPRCVEGKALLLHPLVCAAFNADFDGDQMGIHLPLCFEARAEAWKIIWSQNHLFSVATNAPICSPSQDMILGSSFLTTRNIQKFGWNYLKNFLNKKFDIKKRNFKGNRNFKENILPLFFKKPSFFKNMKEDKKSISISNFKNEKNEIREVLLFENLLLFLAKKNHPFHYFHPLFSKKESTLIKVNCLNQTNQILKQNLWCSYNPILSKFETENKIQKLIELRLNSQGTFQKFRAQFFQQYHSSGAEMLRRIRITYDRIKFYQNLSLFH